MPTPGSGRALQEPGCLRTLQQQAGLTRIAVGGWFFWLFASSQVRKRSLRGESSKLVRAVVAELVDAQR